MVLLAIIALIVIPPEKLPDFARQLARFLNDVRRSTTGLWDDLKNDAALKPEDLYGHRQNVKAPPSNMAPENNTKPVEANKEDKDQFAHDEYLKHIQVQEPQAEGPPAPQPAALPMEKPAAESQSKTEHKE